MLGNQCLTVSPTLHDRALEPIVLEVGVVERDDLESTTQRLDNLEGQLVEAASVLRSVSVTRGRASPDGRLGSQARLDQSPGCRDGKAEPQVNGSV